MRVVNLSPTIDTSVTETGTKSLVLPWPGDRWSVRTRSRCQYRYRRRRRILTRHIIKPSSGDCSYMCFLELCSTEVSKADQGLTYFVQQASGNTHGFAAKPVGYLGRERVQRRPRYCMYTVYLEDERHLGTYLGTILISTRPEAERHQSLTHTC
jgi:hypothetical protein